MANAFCALIPIRSMAVEILDFLQVPSTHKPEVHCSVFEDNQGAYLLATKQKLSVRTKYFCVKHHFFWSYVYHEERNPDGWMVIFKCPTELMNANYFTKGLVRQLFEENRKRLQGWWHAALELLFCKLMLVNKLLKVYNDCMEESKSIQYINGMNSLNSTSSVTYSDVEARWELIWINWTTVRRSDPQWEFQITIWRTVHCFSCFSLNFTIRYLNCKPKYFYFIAFIVLSAQYAHSFDTTPT